MTDPVNSTSAGAGSSQTFSSQHLRAIALLLLTFALAVMRWRSEQFSGVALLLVIVAALGMGIPVLTRFRKSEKRVDWLVLSLLILALLLAWSRLPMLDGLWHNPQLAGQAPGYFGSVLLWLVMVIALVFDSRAKLARFLFAVLLISHLMVGLWFLAKSADPKIDVYHIQLLGAESLLHGVNPFAITFPDVYGPQAHFYPPGIVANGQVQCGYFYLPMSLLLAVPGYLLGDVRFTNLVCLELAAGMIAYGRSTRLSFLCGALVLLCPGVFTILINAWIEPQMLMLMSAAAFFALRGNKWLPWILLGLLLAEKQYLILVAPVFLLLLTDRGAKRMLRAGSIVAITAAIVILPFFFWDPRAFLHSTTALYVNLIRTDSISIPAWLKLKFDIQLHLLITAGVGALAAIVTAVRGRRDPATFAAGIAFVLTVTFLCSTQAFINYYFLATGALCLSLALERRTA